MEEKYVFGIDLGTTYSCISYFDENGQAVVCQNIEGGSTTPSVVRMEPGSEPVVGITAKNTAVIYPENTIQFVKARIGKDASFNYGPDFSQTTTPVEVSSEILKKLARDASAYTNSEVKRVVITVPAYFGDPERKATRQAGFDAGLDVLSIIEEPTAAAVYYGFTKSENSETVVVFDLGGGTFDVTAMKINNGKEFVTITTEGDHDLGGKNWDNALIDLVKSKFEEQTGYDGEYDSDIEQDLLIACEQAKIILTSAEKASVTVNVDRQHKAAINVTREEFEDVTSNLLENAINLTKKVVDRITEPVNKILLVGGSTYMPQVKAAIEREFPSFQIFINDPNESVSKGASIFAFSQYIADVKENEAKSGSSETVPEVTLAGYKPEIIATLGGEVPTIVTVATKSLGVGILLNGKPKINNLIMKDSALPVSVTNVYGTFEANAVNIPIKVYQVNNFEEYYDVDEDLVIGTAMLKLDGDLPAGSPIEVTLSISEDGLIHVKAVDKTKNAVIEANIENDAYTVQ